MLPCEVCYRYKEAMKWYSDNMFLDGNDRIFFLEKNILWYLLKKGSVWSFWDLRWIRSPGTVHSIILCTHLFISYHEKFCSWLSEWWNRLLNKKLILILSCDMGERDVNIIAGKIISLKMVVCVASFIQHRSVCFAATELTPLLHYTKNIIYAGSCRSLLVSSSDRQKKSQSNHCKFIWLRSGDYYISCKLRTFVEHKKKKEQRLKSKNLPESFLLPPLRYWSSHQMARQKRGCDTTL